MRGWDALTAMAGAQHGLVERGQASSFGLDQRGFSRLCERGLLTRVLPAVYRVTGTPVTRHQGLLAACLAVGPGAVASHRSAADLWGVADGWSDVVEVATTRTRWPRLPDVIVHRSTDLGAEHRTFRSGIPVTKPARTLVDLGAVVPWWKVRDVLERMLVARLLTLAGADAILLEHARRGRSGAGVLRKVLDERSIGEGVPDSVLEMRMIRLLAGSGFPKPRFQLTLRDRRGAFLARPDFVWPEHRVIAEVDGFEIHGTAPAMTADLERQNRLVAEGWTLVRFTWEHVVRRPASVIATLTAVLVTSTDTRRPPG